MNNINRLLLQLNKAIECSNSQYNQEKAIAIILLDNLIEVQLYKALTIKHFINKNSENLRRMFYRYKDRDLNNFETLLKYSVKESIITQSERNFISFAHNIRNRVYHQGLYDEDKIELGLILYYVFINQKIFDWECSYGFTSYTDKPEYEQINFAQGVLEKTGMLSEHKQYFNLSLEVILNKWNLKNSLATTCKLIVLDEIKSINSNIKFIEKTIQEENYYSEFVKFWTFDYFITKNDANIENLKNLEYILLYYSFLKKYRDNLNCINDETEFYSKGKIWLKEYFIKYKCKYPYWTNLEKIKKRAMDFEKQSEEKVLQNFIDIQAKINNLYEDISEAASDLDGYLQFLYDQWRGK